MNWYVTGDTHGDFSRFKNYSKEFLDDENSALIILGDSGFNYFLSDYDNRTKKDIKKKYKYNGYIYCVRGNHEARPEDVEGMISVYDKAVDGMVYMQEKFPNIRYFHDGEIYTIDDLKCLVIGGAYSVDKYYRLSTNNIWHENEQLTDEEMRNIYSYTRGDCFDIILSHTCPYDWRPTDLFLSGLDQSTVDNSMEKWMLKMKEDTAWGLWLFGHYHDDRLVRPFVEMYYKCTDKLENIVKRWDKYAESGELTEYWIPKDPNFYMGQNMNEG